MVVEQSESHDLASGNVPWETAVDRQKNRRGEGAHARAGEEKTNVSVIILQQLSLFSNWWAQEEQKCSIGLAGRFVFSFGAAGEPGLDTDADFGLDIVLPLVKKSFD